VNWFEQLGGVLQQYSGASSQQDRSAEDDFDQVSAVAPREAMSGGLADAFRSNDTPPFPNMLGDLFGRSDGQQRANILNTLLATVGPALLSGALSRGGGGGLGSLAGMLGGAMGGAEPRLTPEMAQQIPPQAVEELAREAEQKDPSIIDRVSDFYAENPTLVKGLGAAALAVLMRGMAGQKRGMF
jgi:hypothetical protein